MGLKINPAAFIAWVKYITRPPAEIDALEPIIDRAATRFAELTGMPPRYSTKSADELHREEILAEDNRLIEEAIQNKHNGQGVEF